MTLYIDQLSSPNCEERRGGKIPRYLILHYTGCDADYAAARFMDPSPDQPGGRLSTHYMVHQNGHVTQFVHEKMRAWHAGASYWRGETDINSASIGIEIENLGEYADYPSFPADQMGAVIDLCKDILRRNRAITPFGVLGHSDIAPGRKLDPGPAFPWPVLAAHGVGILPRGAGAAGENSAETAVQDPRSIRNLLTRIGYTPDQPWQICYQSFCAHYAQDVDPDDHARLYHRLQAVATAAPPVLSVA